MTKAGSGTWSLTGNNATSLLGTLTVAGGSVLVTGGGSLAFATYNLQGGRLVLDNQTSDLSNRLGGVLLPAGTLGITLTPQGGELVFGGNASTLLSETAAVLTPGDGGGLLTLQAASSAGLNLTLGTLSARSAASSLLIRGDSLGLAPAAAGIGTLTLTTANLLGGGGAIGSTTMSVRPDVLGDTSATGFGAGFLSVGSYGVRPLLGTELQTSVAALTASGTLENVGLSNTQSLFTSARVNTLTLLSGGSLGVTAGALDRALLNVDAGGILLTAGTANLSVPLLSAASAGTLYVHTLPESTLNVASKLFSLNGLVKAGNGVLSLDAPSSGTLGAGVVLNGGTLRLNSGGANTLLVVPTATVPTVYDVRVNAGATLDLNGQNQAIGQLLGANAFTGMAGTVTSAAPALLTSASSSSPVFAGIFAGSVSFSKQGTGVLTLTGDSTTTGTLSVAGGSLVLKDGGAVLNAGGVVVRQGGLLLLDNSALYPSAAPLASVPVTLQGGSLQLRARQGNESASVGTISIGAGVATVTETLFNASLAGTGGSMLTLGSLAQVPGSFGVVNFVATVGTVGAGIGTGFAGAAGNSVPNQGSNVHWPAVRR